MPPVNPNNRRSAGPEARRGVQEPAADVRFYGQSMRDEAKRRIGRRHPTTTITAELAANCPDLQRILTDPGSDISRHSPEDQGRDGGALLHLSATEFLLFAPRQEQPERVRYRTGTCPGCGCRDQRGVQDRQVDAIHPPIRTRFDVSKRRISWKSGKSGRLSRARNAACALMRQRCKKCGLDDNEQRFFYSTSNAWRHHAATIAFRSGRTICGRKRRALMPKAFFHACLRSSGSV